MNFDRVAGAYRWLERLVYGGALQRARVAPLAGISPPSPAGCPSSRLRVLVLGDGDGRFLEALLERLPAAQVDVVEASAKMITLAQRRVPAGAAVVFHQLPVAGFQPRGTYDLVASHFFLDCLDRGEIHAVAKLVRECVAEDGAWLLADFQIPGRGWLRRGRARVLLWVMYRFFKLAAGLEVQQLVDPAPLLEAGGFSLEARQITNFGFLRADRWRVAGHASLGRGKLAG